MKDNSLVVTKTRDLDWQSLADAKYASRLVLQRWREDRMSAVKLYAGTHWTHGSRDVAEKDFINFLAMYVSVISRHLIAKAPRVLLSTFERAARPVAKSLQTWANDQIKKQRLDETFRRLVVDALFSIGIAKVCLVSPADAALSGWGFTAGMPALMQVDLDDFVFDTHANDFREASFIGHRFRMPLDIARENEEFSPRLRKDLQATDYRRRHNESGDDRIGELTRHEIPLYSEFGQYVDLWELYLPRYRQVVTFVDDNDGHMGHEPIGVKPWLGPDTGPYHMLGYDVVPGNAMPKGPVQDLHNLHELGNRLFAKLARQAGRQKTVTAIRGQADADGKRVIEASDGEAIRVDDPSSAAELTFGGVHPGNLAFFQAIQLLFDFAGGNISILGGLGAQSKTATQDKMLNQNAGTNIVDKQERTVEYISQCMQAMCWYWHNHPLLVMESEKVISEDVSIKRQLFPQGTVDPLGRPVPNARDIPWEKLALSVDPYSLQHTTPQARLGFLSSVIKEIMPLFPFLEQQGIYFDINFWLEKLAEYGDTPDIVELFRIAEPQAKEAGGGGLSHERMMPTSSERTYTRQEGDGRTQKGDQRNMMNAMMGIDTGGAASQKPSQNGQPARRY